VGRNKKKKGMGQICNKEWMLRDELVCQGTIYMSQEDLHDVRKKDGAT